MTTPVVQLPTLTTYLSSYVLSIWSSFDATDSLTDEHEILSIDGLTINTDFVGVKSIPSILNATTISNCADNSYVKAIRLIAPIGHRISASYQQLEDLDKLAEHLRWTHNEQVFLNSLRELQGGDKRGDSSVVLCILRCTAVLERALGNVFLLRSDGSKPVPSLMKDLLVSNELADVFGTAIMSFLQLIIGPPKSLNVRNIVWHGFTAPREIPSKFGYVIVGATATLGRILREKKDDSFQNVCRRPQISLNDSVDVLQGILPDVIGCDDKISSLEKIFKKSRFVPDVMFSYWMEALDRIRNQKYGDAVVLVLPQLEHSLRCLYATINQCPERFFTAQSSEFYTTFDEILAPYLNDGSNNKLIEYLGDKIILAIQDILVFPDGPRLRDRLSHGELLVETIPRVLANHVMGLALYLAVFTSSIDEQTECLETEVREVREATLDYKPIFHPFSIIFCMIVDVYGRCSGPQWIKYLSETDIREQVSAQKQTANLVISKNKLDDDNSIIMKKIFDGTLDHDEIKEWVKQISCLFFHRPPIEWEVLGSLRRSMADVVEIGKQVEQALETRSRMLEEHLLRSRQRATYLRMLKTVPVLLVCVRLVVVVICGFLLNVNSCGLWSDWKQEFERRFLRVMEKCCQNLKSLTSFKKNRWDESVLVSTEFLNKLLTHYTSQPKI